MIGGVLLIGVGALLLLGFFVFQSTNAPVVEEQTPSATEKDFDSEELGFSFTYPLNYTLQTHEQGTPEREWTVLTLIDSAILQSAIENGASEGPPAIALQVFNNPENYSVEQWITSMSYSNYKLATDPTLRPVVVDGEAGFAYRHSGLFETNAIVVEHEGHIYMFSVDWMTAEDQNIKDFTGIVESIRFK